MRFNILNYVEIVSEIPSEYTARCPNCGGKLKIKKENTAYKCFNVPSCTTEMIRAKLGLPLFNKIESPKIPFLQPLSASNLKEKIGSISNVILPIKKEDETVYEYNETFKIKRIDYASKKKSFYPYYKVQNNWIKSSDLITPEEKLKLSCFYREDLLALNEIALIVEGEKCTDFVLSNLGLKSITPPGWGWSRKWLYYHLNRLRPKGILIIPDHDKAGIEKAYLLQKVAWELRIPCSVKFMHSILDSETDIADLNLEKLKIVKEELKDWIF